LAEAIDLKGIDPNVYRIEMSMATIFGHYTDLIKGGCHPTTRTASLREEVTATIAREGGRGVVGAILVDNVGAAFTGVGKDVKMTVLVNPH
jgi:hypothetical protein